MNPANLLFPLLFIVPVVGVAIAFVVMTVQWRRGQRPLVTPALLEAVTHQGFTPFDRAAWSHRDGAGFEVSYRAPLAVDSPAVHRLSARTSLPTPLAACGDTWIRCWPSSREGLSYASSKERLADGTVAGATVHATVREREGEGKVSRPFPSTAEDWLRHTLAATPTLLENLPNAEVVYYTAPQSGYGVIAVEFLDGAQAAEHFQLAAKAITTLLQTFKPK